MSKKLQKKEHLKNLSHDDLIRLGCGANSFMLAARLRRRRVPYNRI